MAICHAFFINTHFKRMQVGQTITKKGKLPKANITLLTLLANTRTAEARKMLKKYGVADATDHNDLELKLAELYQNSTDKIAIEKDFAEMHPHKSLILRNLAPKPEEKVTVQPVTEQKTNQDIRQFVVAHDGYSNCAGNKECQCNKFSNACGCGGSSFNGNTNSPQQAQSMNINNFVGPIMLLSVIGTMAYVLISIHKKHN